MSSLPAPIQVQLPVSDTDSYIQKINSIPMLTAEQESELSNLWYTNQDVNAAKKLVMAHLRFVVRVAKGYLGYGLQLSDLIQEGNIGLMKAVKRFNPNQGVRLVSFAVHWIKAEIHEYIIKNWRIVKVATTKAQRKLFFNLRGMKKRLGWLSEEEINGIAKELGVSCADVREMESRLNAKDAAFDPPNEDEEEANHVWHAAAIEYLVAPESNPELLLEKDTWQEESSKKLTNSLSSLNEREKFVIEKRWLVEKKNTLQEIAKELRISAERVRQIESGALSKLKNSFITQ